MLPVGGGGGGGGDDGGGGGDSCGDGDGSEGSGGLYKHRQTEDEISRLPWAHQFIRLFSDPYYIQQQARWFANDTIQFPTSRTRPHHMNVLTRKVLIPFRKNDQIAKVKLMDLVPPNAHHSWVELFGAVVKYAGPVFMDGVNVLKHMRVVRDNPYLASGGSAGSAALAGGGGGALASSHSHHRHVHHHTEQVLLDFAHVKNQQEEVLIFQRRMDEPTSTVSMSAKGLLVMQNNGQPTSRKWEITDPHGRTWVHHFLMTQMNQVAGAASFQTSLSALTSCHSLDMKGNNDELVNAQWVWIYMFAAAHGMTLTSTETGQQVGLSPVKVEPVYATSATSSNGAGDACGGMRNVIDVHLTSPKLAAAHWSALLEHVRRYLSHNHVWPVHQSTLMLELDRPNTFRCDSEGNVYLYVVLLLGISMEQSQ